MNCKPGDIARIVGLPAEIANANDRFVRVVSETMIDRHPSWKIEGTVWFVVSEAVRVEGVEFKKGQTAGFDEIQDMYLSPIRDPGDDAVDESKAWLPPVPLPTIEPHLLEVGK